MKCVIALISGVIVAGCTGAYNTVNQEFMQQFSAGNYVAAADTMAHATVASDSSDNAYLGGLQCGTGYLWASDSDGRNMCFSAVEKVLSGETEDTSEYKIKSYEKIALATYQGIGEMIDGTRDAGVFFNRAYIYQGENITENEQEITEAAEKLQKDSADLAAKGKGTFDSETAIAQAIAEMDAAPDAVKPMRDYVNPYTTYLGAIYSAVNGDMSNANLDFGRVKTFAPNNSFISSDIDAIKGGRDLVWVFLENGKVGEIKTRSLSPAVLQVFGIRITVPDVYAGYPAVDRLRIIADGKTTNTEFLANMDSIVKTDFNKYRTGNIIKSISFEVGKVAAATLTKVAANKVAHKNNNDAFIKLLGTYALFSIMGSELSWDLRSWQSLPNEIQSARIDMPKNRHLLINGKYDVKIPSGIKNAAVFVRIPTVGANPSIVVGKIN